MGGWREVREEGKKVTIEVEAIGEGNDGWRERK
jgi:hypothetical protein